MNIPVPENEPSRLRALSGYAILDSAAEQAYDDMTYLAANICGTPIALISLVDETRQWFKSRTGLALAQIPRESAFCAHALADPDNLLVIEDASKDPRFASNPLVAGEPHIRFYAGAPLVTGNGEVLGTICVLDRQPRSLDEHALEALRCLSRQVMAQLELRKLLNTLGSCQEELVRLNAVSASQNAIDELTQLYNRHAFQETLIAEWERTFRYSTPLSLLMIGIDHFGPFNDEFGRPAGDRALRRIAQILSGTARLCDMVARCGDEEFAIILPATDSKGALQIAERIRAMIEAENWPHRGLTASIGVANYTNQVDADALFKLAEQALRQAKDQGRNRVARAGTQ
ncbi:MAG: sensor domain-containing diguanylate cyclase [Gallionella sp.]|nr:MAG: sensor domain-containing diguanylate cyclase [Gallionella sp.]